MVFIIQNAQNRDARAMQLKLDEVIRAVKGARTGMVGLEELTDQELCARGRFREAPLSTRRGPPGNGAAAA
jgi:low affinity Fe/Cu permease